MAGFVELQAAKPNKSRAKKQTEKLKTDRCLISEAFYHFIENAFKAEIYGEVELKGKSEPMKVYRLS